MASTHSSLTTVQNNANNKSNRMLNTERRLSMESSVFTLYNKAADELDTSQRSAFQACVRRARAFKTQVST